MSLGRSAPGGEPRGARGRRAGSGGGAPGRAAQRRSTRTVPQRRARAARCDRRQRSIKHAEQSARADRFGIRMLRAQAAQPRRARAHDRVNRPTARARGVNGPVAFRLHDRRARDRRRHRGRLARPAARPSTARCRRRASGLRTLIITRGARAEIEGCSSPTARELDIEILPAAQTTTLLTAGAGAAAQAARARVGRHDARGSGARHRDPAPRAGRPGDARRLERALDVRRADAPGPRARVGRPRRSADHACAHAARGSARAGGRAATRSCSRHERESCARADRRAPAQAGAVVAVTAGAAAGTCCCPAAGQLELAVAARSRRASGISAPATCSPPRCSWRSPRAASRRAPRRSRRRAAALRVQAAGAGGDRRPAGDRGRIRRARRSAQLSGGPAGRARRRSASARAAPRDAPGRARSPQPAGLRGEQQAAAHGSHLDRVHLRAVGRTRARHA